MSIFFTRWISSQITTFIFAFCSSLLVLAEKIDSHSINELSILSPKSAIFTRITDQPTHTVWSACQTAPTWHFPLLVRPMSDMQMVPSSIMEELLILDIQPAILCPLCRNWAQWVSFLSTAILCTAQEYYSCFTINMLYMPSCTVGLAKENITIS